MLDGRKKAEDAEKEFNAKIYDRDFSDALKAALDDVKFSSEAAKKSVMADIKEAGLKLKWQNPWIKRPDRTDETV